MLLFPTFSDRLQVGLIVRQQLVDQTHLGHDVGQVILILFPLNLFLDGYLFSHSLSVPLLLVEQGIPWESDPKRQLTYLSSVKSCDGLEHQH